MADLYIPILLGTIRQDRESEKVANLLLDRIKSTHPGCTTELFDPRQMDLNDDEGTQLRDANPAWRDAIIRADGLIIISPEYNHAFPGSLKRALDVLLAEYIHKAVGLVGVSAQWSGGVRAVQALVPVVRELGLAVTFTDLYFPRVRTAFDENGGPVDPGTFERMDDFLVELVWLASSLRWGRENLPSKYHSS